MTVEQPGIDFGISFSEQADSQIWDPQIMRTDCI